MNTCKHICHVENDGQAWIDLLSVPRAVAPTDQADIKFGSPGGSDINHGVAAEKCRARVSSQCLQRHNGAGRIGLARTVRGAAEDRSEVPGDAKLAEDFLAQELRLIRADREQHTPRTKFGKSFGHPGKQYFAGNIDVTVPPPELVKIGVRAGRVLAHHGRDHCLPAHSIHGLDELSVSRQFGAALSEHLIDDTTGELRTVDKSAVKIEKYVLIYHERFGSESCLSALAA